MLQNPKSFAVADEVADGLFVQQQHKSRLCIARMTRQSAAGVRKGIRQTEFCHYFRTRAFAGTERRDVLRLTQAEDLVGTA